ncbi:MAG: hypothetical protein ACJLTB_16905 [Algoriphagus aquaeductus]|uniref:hypothetical protein n=3 Tax=Algoriphagus TaxID=246875 RepID=UPI003879A3ED
MEKRIKKGMTCASVTFDQLISQENLAQNKPFKAGDVAIFEVLEIGKHAQIQSIGRNLTITPGDRIMGVFGARYATSQFEGYVPQTLQEEYHLLGGGGVVGIVASTHSKYEEEGPTRLKLIGMAARINGKVINTIEENAFKLRRFDGSSVSKTKVILSLGSAMDSGKTTTAAYLCHGLANKGIKSAYIKLTGTAYPKDKNLAYDLGACVAVDFTKYGYPSTYLSSEIELLNLYESLISDVLPHHPEYVVVEIADGLFQRETRMLLNNSIFMSSVHQVVFSAGDSLAALHGVQTLQRWGIMPSALSGIFTASPLLIREVKDFLLEELGLLYLPILNLEDLALGRWPLIQSKISQLQA